MSKNTCFTNENTRLTTNPSLFLSSLSLPLLSPCVRPKRPRVCRHHAHVCFNMCAGCRHTRGRFEWTHGGVSESTYGFFLVFFSVPQHTHRHRPNTQHDHQHHHDHNDTHHNNTITTPHGDRQRQTDTDRDIERRQRKREKRRRKRKREKRR